MTFDLFVDTFLERRRELHSSDMSDERVAFLRHEYGQTQRAVSAAYRPLRDSYCSFLRAEPQYDLRYEDYGDDAGHFPIDHPLITWWEALTFDDAISKWSNADDSHLAPLLARQRAVLDAFSDWLDEQASHAARSERSETYEEASLRAAEAYALEQAEGPPYVNVVTDILPPRRRPPLAKRVGAYAYEHFLKAIIVAVVAAVAAGLILHFGFDIG